MIPDGISAIVFLGGFLSQAAFYSSFSTALESFSGKKVFLVDTRVSDWLQIVSKLGWSLILNKLDSTVKEQADVLLTKEQSVSEAKLAFTSEVV